MTNDDIAAATRKKLAEVLPDLLQATINEYKSYIQKPSTDEKGVTFAKKQSSGKAAVSHIILLLKLASDAGLKDVSKYSSDNLAEAILKANQEYENYKALNISDDHDEDEEESFDDSDE